MPDYDFQSLSSFDFQVLSRDLLQKRLGIVLESFTGIGRQTVEAEIKAIVETTEGKRLQVSFGNENARIYLWQIVEKLR